MLRMVPHPHRPLSGHITCYLYRTYHVLPTLPDALIDLVQGLCENPRKRPLGGGKCDFIERVSRLRK
jgi:hypothetical protein